VHLSHRITPAPVAPHRRTPTRLVEARPPLEIRPLHPRRVYAVVGALRIACFLFQLMISLLFGGAFQRASARRARRTIEALGGLWLKLGQLIALRRDLLPSAYCEELSRLHDRAAGFSPALARAIVERELGVPISEVFSHFEDQPVGAASIAQVHRAQLRFGERPVVVKIQRPDVRDKAEATLGWIRRLIDALVRFNIAPHFEWRELYAELSETAREELDFRIEGSSLLRMRRQLREDRILVPRTYSHWTTRDVLVMEYIDGVFMSEYIAERERDPARVAAWERENRIDRRKVARRLYESTMRQLFKRNLFHADMHPGNIILLRDSKVALIDFGSVGFLDAEFLSSYRFFLEAIAARDYGRAVDVMFLMVNGLPEADIATIRAEVVAKLRAWEMRASTRTLEYEKKSLTSAVSDVFLSLTKHKIALSWSFLRVDRAEMTLDESLRVLDPGANYIHILRRSFLRINAELLAEQLEPASMSEHAGRFALGLLRITRDLDEQVAHVTRQIRQNVQVFRATTSKVADLLGWFTSLASTLFLAVLVYMIALLFWKREHGWARKLLGREATDVAAVAPDAYSWWWVAILGGLVWAWVSTRRLGGRFKERSSRQKRGGGVMDLL
jgi:ubiquinone biosynthesis protein